MALRAAEFWIDQYKAKKAYWLHDGNSKRPHALLSSRLHSNGFFNSRSVIADDALLREVTRDLVERLSQWLPLHHVRRVVGPATGATKLAQFAAEEITKRGFLCEWASPVKEGEGSERRMVFTDPTRKPLPHECVWFVEDVLTTGGSVEQTKEAVRREGAIPILSVGVIVNRSGLVSLPNGRYATQIFANVDKPMPMWTSRECPLCKLGSEAIPPKPADDLEGRNWARLNAEY